MTATPPLDRAARPAWRRPVLAAIATTALVTALSYLVPAAHAASAVGLGFLAATYFLTLRGGRDGRAGVDDDAEAARHFGLSLGGLLDVEPLDLRRLARSALTEVALALALSAIVLPPFWIGFKLWWSPASPFRSAPVQGVLDESLGQLLVIALPEEAFYRGFLQTSLDDAWPPRLRFLDAWLGPGVLVTSAVFALGHVATEVEPSRLAVFFPSLLFGYLRSRRGGIGCAAAFHAICNLFASYLAQSYGLGGG